MTLQSTAKAELAKRVLQLVIDDPRKKPLAAGRN
jgi:hypothetical protein